jgi:4-amino-4-deoxy-L-arabinose transferase-like glycosyltransferase
MRRDAKEQGIKPSASGDRPQSVRRLSSFIHRPSSIALALALCVYALAVLPWLGDFPLMTQDEPWIAAPAAKLATQGIYGDDLFAGYYGMEQRTFNFPPLFPFSLALVFRLFGVGALQARCVAAMFGAATLALTYVLGRRLYGGAVGALAVWLLIGLRLTLEPSASGVPLLDLARIARYDIAVPPLMLATLVAFVAADAHTPERSSALLPLHSHWRYVLTGALAGLTLLAHVYGGAVLVVIGILLLWRHGLHLIRQPAPYLIAAGCGLALLPWALFIAGAPDLYQGQMLPEQTRFHFWELDFFRESLQREPDRYARFFYANRAPVLWPRLGIWLAVLGVPLSLSILLFRCARRGPVSAEAQLRDRLLLVAGPAVALLLALLVNLKFYNYAIVVLPFGALLLAFLGVQAWRAAGRLPRAGQIIGRAALGLALALALAEGAAGILKSQRSAAALTPYLAYTERVADVIPAGSRVLALHQFWFGVYPQGYDYRSMVLPFYLTDARTYPDVLLMEEALAQIDPEYILVDQAMAPELQMDIPADQIADERRRGFRRYMERHRARPIASFTDPDYGPLTIYRLVVLDDGP